VELGTEASKLIILSLYKAPMGDFNQFIKNLDDTLKYLYKPKPEFLICGAVPLQAWTGPQGSRMSRLPDF
jgi:hypothetical protein